MLSQENLCSIIPLICAYSGNLNLTLKILRLNTYFNLNAEPLWQIKFNTEYTHEVYFPDWTWFENYYSHFICNKENGFMAVAVNFGNNEDVDPMIFEYDKMIEYTLNMSRDNDDIRGECFGYELLKFKLNKRYMTVAYPWRNYDIGVHSKFFDSEKECAEEYTNFIRWCNKEKTEAQFVTINLNNLTPFFLGKGFHKKNVKGKGKSADISTFHFVSIQEDED